MTGMELKKYEAAFKASAQIDLQKNFCVYLKGMKDLLFLKLIQEDTQDYTVEERNIIIGELRILQKLLNVLEPKSALSPDKFENRGILL